MFKQKQGSSEELDQAASSYACVMDAGWGLVC